MDYERFAEAYAAENESGLFNAHYERPATLALLGDVAGQRVLDAGCGAGPLAEELVKRGATVSCLDVSPAMVALARKRLGDDAEVRVADLAAALPFDDESFDAVACSLALHYVKDWSGPVREFRRILADSGRLVVSVNHPLAFAYDAVDQYFDTVEHSFDADLDGESVTFTTWHRPLSDMADAFTQNGFRIASISEPPVAPDTPQELLPPGVGPSTRFISMLFFVLEPA